MRIASSRSFGEVMQSRTVSQTVRSKAKTIDASRGRAEDLAGEPVAVRTFIHHVLTLEITAATLAAFRAPYEPLEQVLVGGSAAEVVLFRAI